MNLDNKSNPQNQPIIIKFNSFLYQIIVPKETTTIKDLKKTFFDVFPNQGINNKPQLYYCYDINARLLNENEIIQDIIKQFYHYIELKRIDLIEQDNSRKNEQLVVQQNEKGMQQQLIQIPFNNTDYGKQESGFWLYIAYRNIEYLIQIPAQDIKCNDMKNMVIMVIKENGIIINDHFCQLIKDGNVLDGEKNINPKILVDYKKIILEDYEEWVIKQQNLWDVCLVNQYQIKQKLFQSKNSNEMLNLKQILECWTQKEKAKFKIFPISSYTNLSRIFIIGPKNSPYQDGIYEILCKIPETYPFEPPQFYFVTKIYHPNIINGKIAMDQFEEIWDSKQTLESAVQQIIDYLNQPNLQYTLNQESAEQYLTDKDTFNQIVEEYKTKYAKPELDDILKSLLGQVPSSNEVYTELLEEFDEWIIYWVHQSR